MTMETKERAALPWPAPPDDDGAPAADLARAREALAAEWRAANPQTPDAVQRFYRNAGGLGADLEAWHRTPERAEWTRMLVHVATQANVRHVVDIGCGAGHDVLALRTALPRADLEGVEPNHVLRRDLYAGWPEPSRHRIAVHADVSTAVIETADLLVCIDVLEHVPDPETFLGGIAQRVPVGCLLFETTATHDVGTPLHLPANRGWHPGRVLERHGWELADHTGRVRVWRRVAEAGRQRASLLLCAYRNVAVSTLSSIMGLCAGNQVGNHWRLKVKSGDALISRSRSIIVTAWWRETNDDVLLMLDDDIAFSAADADRLTELCRNGHDIVCAAYPVHNGGHLSCRLMPGTAEVQFGPGQPPLEIQFAATGFMAVQRRVIDALVGTVPLCHADQSWSFYPLFRPLIVENDGGHEWLSEDWAFSQVARQAGFSVWLDPQTRLTHLGQAGISVANMAAMHQAIAQV